MPSDMQIDLSKTRLQIARERLAFAEEILKLGDYKTVANRSSRNSAGNTSNPAFCRKNCRPSSRRWWRSVRAAITTIFT